MDTPYRRYTVVSAPTVVNLAPLAELLRRTRLRTGRNHFPTLAEVPPAGKYRLNVTNTGLMDADDVVLGFISPPGAGTNGLPLQTLFGFERVFVKAGESVTVDLFPQLTEFAATGVDGDKSALAGTYLVSFGVREAAGKGMGFATARVAASFL